MKPNKPKRLTLKQVQARAIEFVEDLHEFVYEKLDECREEDLNLNDSLTIVGSALQWEEKQFKKFVDFCVKDANEQHKKETE